NLAATAELAFGHGRRTPDFAFLSVGTGVGLALVLDGRLRTGAGRSAGEIGYLPVPATATLSSRSPGDRRRAAPPVLEDVAAAAVARERVLGRVTGHHTGDAREPVLSSFPPSGPRRMEAL